MSYGDLWSNRKYPNGCRNCGQTEKKHVGFGLCQNCYRDLDIREAARNDTLVELATVVEPIVEETIEENEPSPSHQERRPGSFSSPVSETDGVPGGSEPKKRFSWGKKEPRPDGGAPKTAERAPKGAGRRVSVADTLEDVWTGIGGLAVRTNHAPLGRYLQWQAPAAGQLLDEVVAGTVVDKKLLQPAVKARGRLDVVIALLAPPGIIMAIERNPQNAQVLLPALKSALRSSLPTLLPAMKKAAAREQKVNEAIADMFPDMPEGVDPIDLVIEQLFNGYVFNAGYNENEPTTEEANAQTST